MHRNPVEPRLERLEAELGATVLAARDLGSRAWNLHGPDSDRDVAVVFKQPAADYVRLGAYRENVDREIGGDTFSGWNVTRFADLLTGSNPTVLEFLNSDVRYRNGGRAWTSLREYANRRFKPIALMGHYRSLAKRNYEKYVVDGSDPSVKRHLYVIRALLYRRWVETTHEMPPLDFVAFLDEHVCTVSLELAPGGEDALERARQYAAMKKRGQGDVELGNPLREWIEAELERGLDPTEHDVRGIETERVNRFLVSCFEEFESSTGGDAR